MSKKKNPIDYVPRTFCDERFGRIIDKLNTIDSKVTDLKNSEKEKGRDWRLLGFAILGSVVSGIATAVIVYCLHV